MEIIYTELVKRYAEKFNISRVAAKARLAEVRELITELVSGGNKVQYKDFLVLELSTLKERTGKNPVTLEEKRFPIAPVLRVRTLAKFKDSARTAYFKNQA